MEQSDDRPSKSKGRLIVSCFAGILNRDGAGFVLTIYFYRDCPPALQTTLLVVLRQRNGC
jgi:hypothetical protein